MKQLYSLILLCSVIIPLAFSFHPNLKFYRYFKGALLSILIVACPFILWDMYFAASLVWGFNRNYLLGVSFFNLPIEEVLFFLCIPFSCLFTYHSVKILIKEKGRVRRAWVWTVIAGVILIILGLTNYQKMYSLWAFTLSGFSLLVVGIINPVYLSKFLISYVILLIPFFIVNGILTGTGPDSPVVWYNGAENLGVRIVTIPVEDFFYGMILILWNVILFEIFSKTFNHGEQA